MATTWNSRPNPPAATPAPTMKAVVQDRYGPPDVLALGEVERPTVGPDEVLVRVVAAGVDRGVWHLMTGLPYLTRAAFGLRRPRHPIPGLDLAGTVETVGHDVTRFAEGDHVFGIGKGTFAEYAVASEERLAAAPRAIELAEAGALAVSGSTALQAVENHARVQAGQRVLILGASGGVGSYAVQIAKASGAVVTGVASGDKLEFVTSLGADDTIDYRRDDPLDGASGYDVIIDTGGNRSLGDLRRALTPTGTLVIVGGENGGRWIGGIDRQFRATLVSITSRRRLTTFVAKEDAAHLERLADLVDNGHVVPAVSHRFSLHEAAVAIRHLLAGHAEGKILIDMRHGSNDS